MENSNGWVDKISEFSGCILKPNVIWWMQDIFKWWLLLFVSVKIGGNSNLSCQGGCKALVDTGGGYSMGVDDPFAVNNAIGAHYNETLDEFLVNCKDVRHLPMVELQIAGQPFSLSGQDYIMKVSVNNDNISIAWG